MVAKGLSILGHCECYLAMVRRILPGMQGDLSSEYPTADDFLSPHPTVMSELVSSWADKLCGKDEKDAELTPGDWIEKHFLIDRPRDPVTAEVYGEGPIILSEYQKRILAAALERDADGKFKYDTIVWSEPKKSGKTALAAAVTLYMAATTKSSNIYCLANDGKQSQDRIFKAMDRCITLHNKHGGMFEGVRPIWAPPSFKLTNGTIVEAIPCDAAGEAGSEPLMTVWSEMWGYKQEAKERLWTEMTIPPTLYGYAIRWVESYAGYEDESTVLWNLYDNGVNHGVRHPQLMDLPVYVNGRQFTFWSHEHRMPWQTKEYYENEVKLLFPNEYLRIHENRWVSATSSLLESMITWDRCQNTKLAGPLPAGDMTPMVIALDASVSGDASAIVGVTRNPDDEWDAPIRRVAVRHVSVYYPPSGGKINYSETMEPEIRLLVERYNVYKVVYDPYQLHKMCTDLRMEGVAAFDEFDQGRRRSKADKQLYDMIIMRQISHDGDPELRKHIQACAAKSEGQNNTLRFVKKANGRPIDLAVALSMATDEVLRLNI